MSEIINKFNIFRHFPPNFKENIKLFHVSREDFGYCVLNDNKVYGFGEKFHEILSYNMSEEKFVLINELNDKNIVEFYNGFYQLHDEHQYMFGRNNESEIFSWGGNNCGQLARGYQSRIYPQPEKINFFDGKDIIEISCGSHHCLALSSDGRVFKWGLNGYLEREEHIFFTPIEINFKEKIKFIHCSRDMSFSVSFDGNPYYWGYDSYSCETIFTPKLIALNNVSKLYCDSSYIIIILSNNGNIFEFNLKNEKIIEIKSNERFIDLYCEKYRDYFILQSEECVHQLVKGSKNEINPKIIKTNSFNFFDFCSQNTLIYGKTIEITKEGYLVTKGLQFDYINKILSLKYENIFDKKYEKLFDEKREIGQGGIGSVFEANKKSNNILYAIKMMEIRDKSNLNEIKIISELNKDFVVQYIDSWIEGKLVINTIKPILYIQMELCEHNLREFIELMKKTFEENFKTLQYFISCEIFKELIECVNYLHSLIPPIIHRDLKPENIVLKRNNKRITKLCDFGLAKVHEESNHTRGQGTFKYMAPEVFSSRKYNIKSDIYSLALIGTEIFGFEDNVEEIRKHKTREDFDKYISKYLNTGLETKFIKLLDLISNCLLPEDYHSRPDCKQLLEKFNEFSIDKNIELNDNSISLVNNWKLNSKLLLEKENTILKEFIENKFDLL